MVGEELDEEEEVVPESEDQQIEKQEHNELNDAALLITTTMTTTAASKCKEIMHISVFNAPILGVGTCIQFDPFNRSIQKCYEIHSEEGFGTKRK